MLGLTICPIWTGGLISVRKDAVVKFGSLAGDGRGLLLDEKCAELEGNGAVAAEG